VRWFPVSDDLYIGPTVLAPGTQEPRLSGERIAKIIVIPLLLLLMAILLIFFVLFAPVTIDGPSMLPTLRSADRVLITRGDKSVNRGDVIVLVVQEAAGKTELVKRVVGLPGDSVEIRNDVAFVNGVQEPSLGQVVGAPQYSTTESAITVPAGRLYVMGDNRPLSEDSRYIGTVPMSGVMGRVVAVFAPLQRFQVVH
jgi:signal peptidase I